MEITTVNLVLIVALTTINCSSSLPNNRVPNLSLDPAISKVFQSIRDLEGLQQYFKELKTNARTQLLLQKAEKVLIQLEPSEIEALKQLSSHISELNPTHLVSTTSGNFLIHSQDLNELIDFNQLLETSLELLQSDPAVQFVFNEISSPQFANLYKRLIQLSETKDLLENQFGISIASLSETLEQVFSWNIKSSSANMIMLYKSPVERIANALYPMMNCQNCPGCTACLPCCTLRKYLTNVLKV